MTTAQLETVVAGALGTFISTAAADVVGVYKQDTFIQVFAKARPIKAEIKEDSKLMEHPLENGATVVDHRIVLPVEIELSLVLLYGEYREVYEEIKQAYLNATLLSAHTKTSVYDNLIIASLPHVEDADMYDAVALALKLREVQFITVTSTVVPLEPKNKSTTERGTQQTKTPNEQDADEGTVLYRAFN